MQHFWLAGAKDWLPDFKSVCEPRSMTKRKNRGHPSSSMRIVSLAPSATSILCELGAKPLLVGVTKWCSEVAPVEKLPRLGDCWYMNSVAEVLALRPTLVIGSVPYKRETVAKLLEHPLNFLGMNPRTLADIEADIRLLGNVVGRASAAENLVRRIRRDLAAIARKSAALCRRVQVYSEAWPNPRISSPPWVAELIKIAGGAMVVPTGEKVSDEQVAAAQPEVIVLAWAATGAKADPARAYGVAAWRDIPAIRHRRVHVISDELLNTPGPPLVKGAKELWKLLNPGKKSQTKGVPPNAARSARQ
jgi:iron complex transport system substrate-binding protein